MELILSVFFLSTSYTQPLSIKNKEPSPIYLTLVVSTTIHPVTQFGALEL